MLKKPGKVGLTDPKVTQKIQADLIKARTIAQGKQTLTPQGQLIKPSTTVTTTSNSVSATTSTNNQVGDTVTVTETSGTIYVSAIDQTIQNITYGSTTQTGTGNVTFNNVTVQGTGNLYLASAPGGANIGVASTGNVTYPSGTTIQTTFPLQLLVSNWADGTVSDYNLATSALLETNFIKNGPIIITAMKVIKDLLGNLYVIDIDNGAVYRYTSTGVYTDTFIQPNADLTWAYDMKFGPNGNLFILVNQYGGEFWYNGAALLEYDGSSGAFVRIVTQSDPANLLDQGYSFAFSNDGTHLFIAGTLNPGPAAADGVNRYLADGTFVDQFVPAGDHNIVEPNALEFDIAGNLYVGNKGPTSWFLPAPAAALAPGEKLTKRIKVKGSRNEAFKVPLKATPLLLAGASGNVLKYNGTTGAFISTFIASGANDLQNPSQIGFGADGYVYITDAFPGPTNSGRVLKYSTSGTFISQITSGLNEPWGFVFITPKSFDIIAPVDTAVTIQTKATGNDRMIASFSPSGNVSLPGATTLAGPLILPTYADNFARDGAIPNPTVGMVVFVIFDNTLALSNVFEGYNGGGWVALN